MKFGFNIQKWVLWLLPAILRKPRTIAWLNSLLAPVATLHTVFLSKRLHNIERASITPQVCKLRGLLNKRFDPQKKRISILDFQAAGQTFIFTEVEQRPVYLPIFISSGEKFDFVVEVPYELEEQNVSIEGILNDYKLPSKKYKISYI